MAKKNNPQREYVPNLDGGAYVDVPVIVPEPITKATNAEVGDRVSYTVPGSLHADARRPAVIVDIASDGNPILCVTASAGDFPYAADACAKYHVVDHLGQGVGYDATGKPGTWRYATEQPKAAE